MAGHCPFKYLRSFESHRNILYIPYINVSPVLRGFKIAELRNFFIGGGGAGGGGHAFFAENRGILKRTCVGKNKMQMSNARKQGLQKRGPTKENNNASFTG
jgi:hypothetical protein